MKPKCKVVGEDGNIFAVLAKAKKSLVSAGQEDKVEEMKDRVFTSGSYHEALGVIGDYVEMY